MPNNQRGFAHILVILVLLAGVAASVYLVQQRTNFLPHAESRPISNPITPTPTLPVSRPITPPKNCPLLAPIKCPDGLKPVSQGNDAKGCPLPPTCEKVACSACIADVAKSGSVDIMDFSKFRMCFGKSSTEVDSAGTSCALSDFDQDGSVTLSDFNCLREVFGQTCSTPVPTATPTTKPTISCNTDVSLGISQSGNQVIFKITGDASTYIGDDYGGGVKTETCTGAWNNKSCQVSSSGNYIWTHTWRHCIDSFDNCSSTCTISSKYTTMLSPTATPTPKPTVSSARVFVTSTTYNGNLGGLSGADAKCQERANAANLGGTWKAWLSDNNTSATSRLNHLNVPYKILNSYGTIIANRFDDFINSAIPARINITEYGNEVTVPVWTNTSRDGTVATADVSYALGAHCFNWKSSTNVSTMRGAIGSSNGLLWQSAWTLDSSQTCGKLAALYCFEQVAGQGSVNTTSGANVAKSNSKIPASLACTPCQADINKDGSVSITDFTKLSGCYNKPSSGNCAGVDINGDGSINSKDLSCLMSQFGKKCSR